MKRFNLLSFIAVFILLFESCDHVIDARLDLNGYTYYPSVQFLKPHNYNMTVLKKDGVRYLRSKAEEMFNESTSELYDYNLSIDIFLPDTALFEGKRFSLSDPLEKDLVLESWNNLSTDATSRIMFEKPNVFITLYRVWIAKGLTKSHIAIWVKEFSGLDGWVSINKNDNDELCAQFECVVVSEEDGETFKISGYCGK